MKFVREFDEVWHDSQEELTPITTKVEFMNKEGSVFKGTIQVDMAGHYAYLEEGGYSSFDQMVKWRFRN